MPRASIDYRVGVDDQTKRGLNAIEKRFARVGRVAGIAIAGGVSAGTAALTALTRKGLQSADALGKVSDKLGEIPSKIQGLQRAAELTGVSVETTNMALQRMVRRVSEAAQGTGEAQTALKELGLDAQKLNRLSPADQFQAIAGAMEGTANQSDKVRLSMRLFDSEGVSLVNTLNLGKQGLQDIQDEINDYGLALTRVDIAKIEAANDSFTRAKSVVTGFGQQFAAQVAPVLEGIANKFLDAAKEAGGMGNVAQKAFSAITRSVGFVLDAINGISLAFKFVKQAALGAILVIVESLAFMERGVLGFINTITGSEIEGAISGLADKLRAAAFEASNDFQSALLTPPPSEKIEEFIAPIIAQSQAAAERAAAAAAGSGTGGTEDPVIDREADAEKKLEELQLFHERKFGIEEFYRQQELSLHKQHEIELSKITNTEEKRRLLAKQRAEKAKVDKTKKFMSDGFNALAQNSKKAFQIQKAYRIAETVQNTYSAAVGAYNAMASIPYIGPALGVAAAAAAVAFGVAQVNAIRSSQPGGGISGGAVPSAPSASSGGSVSQGDIAEAARPEPNVVQISFDREGITDTNALRDFIQNDFAEALQDTGGLEVQVIAR